MCVVDDGDPIKRTDEHRLCKYCEYDLFGQPISMRYNPFKLRMGRCVRCPECGRVNFLDHPNLRDQIRGWRAVYWMMIGTMIIAVTTMVVIVLTGQILDLLSTWGTPI